MPPRVLNRRTAATAVVAMVAATATLVPAGSAATQGAVALSEAGCSAHQFPALAADPFSDRVVAVFETDGFTGAAGNEVASSLVGAGFSAPQPGPVVRVSQTVEPGVPVEIVANPAIAYNATRGAGLTRDNYVVVFPSGADGIIGSSIEAQLVSSTGQPIGASRTISDGAATPMIGRLPDIAYDAAREDEFVAVWVDANSRRLLGRRVDHLGQVSGPTFVVDTAVDITEQPAVAVDPFTGRMLVAAGSAGQIQVTVLEGRDPVAVSTRWAASEGTAAINNDTGGPDIAVDTNRPGGLVVWAGSGGGTSIGSNEWEIWARRIGADGSPVGDPIRVSDMGPSGSAAYGAFSPSVAFDPDNDRYIVVWDGDDQARGDERYDIWTRSIGVDGAALGPARRITDVPAQSDAVEPVVAVSGSGRALVAWHTSEGCADGGTRVMASFVPAAVPAAPAAPLVSAGDASAVVWWNPPADDGGAELTGYRITASPSGGSLDVGAGTTLVTFEGLQNGTGYTFTVEALNGVGASAPSAASAVVVPAGPPQRPSAPLASAGDGWVQVSWTAPGDGGSTIEHYVVRASPGGAEQIVQAPDTEVLFGGLTNGTAYRFSVTAVNAVGESDASAMSDRATPVASARVPERPGRPRALAGDGTAQLWWAPPANAVSAYQVEAWLGPVGSGDPIASLQVATNEAVVEGLNNARSYTFTVAGVNSAGAGERSPESNVVTPKVGAGYWVLGSDGQVYPFGDAELYGDLVDEMALPVLASIDIERLPTGDGYWILDSLGRVWAFGNAQHHGNVDLARLRPGETPATMSSTPTGDGYWVFTDAGRALAFGSARSFGDVSDLDLDGPIISSVATPTGRGYYMVGADGGIFALGDAAFQGSIPQVLPGVALDGPVVGIVPTPTGRGYWLVASDGGVFAFGDAWFNNSIPGVLADGETLVAPVNGMVAFADGYVMVAGDGGVFNFSSRPFFGSLGADRPANPIVGISPQEPVPAPGRFVGEWTGPDPGDGSTQTIQISATGWVDEPTGERWTYRVRWEDDRATSCRPHGDDYPARLVSSASGPGNSLVVEGRFVCAAPTGDVELEPFNANLVYNPATDTLSDGISEFRRP